MQVMIKDIHPVLENFSREALALSLPLEKEKILELRKQLTLGRPKLIEKYGVGESSGENNLGYFTYSEKSTLEKMKTSGSILDSVKKVSNNPFAVESIDLNLDLLTDSGTSTLTERQREIMAAWENNISSILTYSYAKPLPRIMLDNTIHSLFGENQDFFLTTQGRGSEFLLLNGLHRCDLLGSGDTIVSNRPFDTTKGHIENVKNKVIACTPLTDPESYVNSESIFLGDLDIERLRKADSENGGVKIILVTVTDNGGGGQPVSMKNYKEVVNYARENDKLIWVDGCRILENALFIHIFDDDYSDASILDIAKEMLSLSDISTISFKKVYSHSGGGILVNKDSKLLEGNVEKLGLAIKEMTTVIYGNGFDSYSGRTGMDMIEIISGLYEGINPKRVASRILQPFLVGAKLREEFGLPAVSGGHAIYLAADKILKNVRDIDCPAEYLNAIILSALTIRGCGLGIFFMGEGLAKESVN